MADITLNRDHHLGLKGAKVAADQMIERLSEKFDLTGKWQGNVMNFSRPGVNGCLTISESNMSLEVTLGFLLKAMKGPIERSCHEQLDQVLKSAKPAAKAAPKAVSKSAVKLSAKPATTKK